MSWSFGFVTTGVAADFDTAFDGANNTYHTEQSAFGNPVSSDTDDQIDAAGAAAKSIVTSGAVGDAADLFNVNISGHANPGHSPVAGMSNDTVYVSVTYTT